MELKLQTCVGGRKSFFRTFHLQKAFHFNNKDASPLALQVCKILNLNKVESSDLLLLSLAIFPQFFFITRSHEEKKIPARINTN